MPQENHTVDFLAALTLAIWPTFHYLPKAATRSFEYTGSQVTQRILAKTETGVILQPWALGLGPT
jgi:hypothetical protein